MSGTKPIGKPVDDLDKACFQWRKCNECVGEQCTGYKMDTNKECSKFFGRFKIKYNCVALINLV